MKKSINVALIVVLVILTILSGLAWFDNISIALQWNPGNGHQGKYSGLISWMDWASVDFSTATTFIPFFGFLLITAGLIRISGSKSEPSEYFPFFRSYNAITVTLGLIGTVWGLIMIGFYKPDTIQMSDLILCMRTALFSTLVALIWVFPLGYPIGWVMRWWERQVSEREDVAESDITKLFEELSIATIQARDGLKTTATEAKALNTALQEFTKNTGVNVFQAVKDSCGNLTGACTKILEATAGMKEESEARYKLALEQSAALATTVKELGVERDFRQRLESSLREAETKRQKAEVTAQQALTERDTAQQEAKTAQKQANNAVNRLNRIAKLLPPQSMDEGG